MECSRGVQSECSSDPGSECSSDPEQSVTALWSSTPRLHTPEADTPVRARGTTGWEPIRGHERPAGCDLCVTYRSFAEREMPRLIS